jgi:hypothetical protein
MSTCFLLFRQPAAFVRGHNNALPYPSTSPVGITSERTTPSCATMKLMTDDQQRTDASSRERSPDHKYSLSIDQAAELYAAAGLPRTKRSIQKYCALTKLDCHKVETEIGEKYLVAPYSVERHIAYINEVRTDATSRELSRTDASVRFPETNNETAFVPAANEHEQGRMATTVRPTEERYVTRVEEENTFLRAQIEVKDTQIGALLERDKETNTLIHRLQAMLAPLLVAPNERRSPPEENGQV